MYYTEVKTIAETQTQVSDNDHFKYALELADQVNQKHLKNIDLENRELLDHLNALRGDSNFVLTWEPFSDLHKFITEVACILSNPEISNKLSKYSQEHAGNMLGKMLWFFERMQDENMNWLLLHHRLSNYRGNTNADELTLISQSVTN